MPRMLNVLILKHLPLPFFPCLRSIITNDPPACCLVLSFPPPVAVLIRGRKNDFTMAMEESWPSMTWSSVRSWFTPTVLFLLINLVIGTIVLTSSSHRRRSHRRPHGDETAGSPHELPPLVRGPSAALERLRSLGLHRFRSGEIPFDAVALIPQPLARGPSALLERLRSIGLNRFRSGEIPLDALPIPDSGPPPAPTKDSITTGDDDDDVRDHKSRHYERVRSDSGKEEATGIKLAERMKKSASTSSAFGHFEEAEIVRRQATAASKGGRGSAVAEEEEEVDARADDFINRFRQQLQLQRLDSIMRYKEMLNRSK